MSDTVISVENLSKQYRLGLIGGATFREEFSRWWAKKLGRPDPYRKIGQIDHGNVDADGEHIWALRDVSFEVKEGEILGIIGRNGAGKSTLLKILSRIVSPTSGRIKVKGRVASLLEVGTGFHPELTGRENIYLNGAILGMKKAEINRKLDEIIAFSEIEDFIDTPVKRYSSGMTVRLAFAVAAHLEPEILVVDEVLAVGDAAFQKKCLGKMEDVSRGGRTVLFISHQMDMIKGLCDQAIFLERGKIELMGTTTIIVDKYLEISNGLEKKTEFKILGAENSEVLAQITSARLVGPNNSKQYSFSMFETLTFEITYDLRQDYTGMVISVHIKKDGQVILLSFDTDDNAELFARRSKGRHKYGIHIPNYFKPGKYTVSFGMGIANIERLQYLDDVLNFESNLNISREASLSSYSSRRPGLISLPVNWHEIHLDS